MWVYSKNKREDVEVMGCKYQLYDDSGFLCNNEKQAGIHFKKCSLYEEDYEKKYADLVATIQKVSPKFQEDDSWKGWLELKEYLEKAK